jgi:hypothetical protein
MGIGPIVSLASGLVQSLFSGSSNNTARSSAGTSASASPSDSNQLSPFAQILGSLQQLQQTNPAQYQQVTLQISNNLQTASQSATSSGNSALASELNQLSTDFNASTSGQLPNVQDLAQAVGGGGHHHHHGGGSSAPSASSTTDPSIANPAATTTAATGLSQLIQSLTATQNNSALNPQSIILNTLSGAGVQIV